WSFETTSASVADAVANNTLRLEAYPDPFNGNGHVSLYLPEASDASLQLFDLQGRIIADLSSGPMASGKHDIRFDINERSLNNLPNGTYLFRLRTSHGAAAQRI